jgi:hypothetical protein
LDSLELLKQDDHVARRGLVMAVMARALTRYAEVKEPRENYQRVVKLYEAAMGILKDPEYAGEREKIKEELREAVGKLAESNN